MYPYTVTHVRQLTVEGPAGAEADGAGDFCLNLPPWHLGTPRSSTARTWKILHSHLVWLHCRGISGRLRGTLGLASTLVLALHHRLLEHLSVRLHRRHLEHLCNLLDIQEKEMLDRWERLDELVVLRRLHELGQASKVRLRPFLRLAGGHLAVEYLGNGFVPGDRGLAS